MFVRGELGTTLGADQTDGARELPSAPSRTSDGLRVRRGHAVMSGKSNCSPVVPMRQANFIACVSARLMHLKKQQLANETGDETVNESQPWPGRLSLSANCCLRPG